MSDGPRKKNEGRRRAYLPDLQRLLPQSPDAEKGVLGSMLIGGPEIIEELDHLLTPEHFHVPAHSTIFHIITTMHRSQVPIDLITLTTTLRDQELLDGVGGAAFITELFTSLPTAANYRFYAGIVTEKFILRTMVTTCTEFAARGYEEQEDPRGLLDELQAALIEITAHETGANSLRHIREDAKEAVDRYEARYHQRGQLGGFSSGFVDLDRMLDGIKPPGVYVVAGRPAMGKTSFGLEIATHVALVNVEKGVGVGIFSVEMTREQIMDRMVASRAEVTQEKLRRGFLSDNDITRMHREITRIADSNLWLDDTGGLTITKFRAQARRAVVRHKCQLLLIDYVQLMKGVTKQARENETAGIAEVMKGIVETAKELKVPIIALAQVNREGEQRRGDHRPSMGDLKGSGAIEEGAYFVGLLYRPVYYCQTDKDRKKVCDNLDIGDEELDTYAELIVAKHRNGPVGPVKLKFIGEFTRYEDTDEAKRRPLYSNNTARQQALPSHPPQPNAENPSADTRTD